jgi:hypothetical protein
MREIIVIKSKVSERLKKPPWGDTLKANARTASVKIGSSRELL